MLYAAGCAFLALRQAFASEYMLADDVREHVFWMFRYVDPRLFPQDPSLITSSLLRPRLRVALLVVSSGGESNPLLAKSKLLPSVLSLIAVGYFFGLHGASPAPRAVATLTTILFSQALWLNSDLSSATPRAFFYPFFVAFLYYQVRGLTLGVDSLRLVCKRFVFLRPLY